MADGNGHVQASLRKSKHPEKCGVCESTKHSTGWHEAQIAHWAHHDWDEYVDLARASSFKRARKVAREQLKEERRTRPGSILIEVASLESNVTDAIELLADDPSLYQRAGELVRVVRVTEAEQGVSNEKKGQGIVQAGTPLMKNVPEADLMARMSRHVPCEKMNLKGSIVDCDPPIKLVRSILSRAEYPPIRLLRGIAEAPFLRPGGSICQTPGYDAMTGYLYVPRLKFPEIKDKPTKDDAVAAFKKLWHVFAGLEYVDDSARACPIAGILTIFAQAAINGCVPIFMTEANTQGTGKTITVDAIGIITSGRPMPRRSFPGPGDELRKVLDAYARDGVRYFCLDNIGQDFGGEALEAAVTTEGQYDIRILGETRNLRVEWTTIVFGTGNNIGFFRTDIVPRTLMSRMVTESEDPRGRDVSSFLIKENLRTYVQRHRAELTAASLTVLRAFEVAGRPAQACRPWGSFEAFRGLIPQAIMFAGGPDVTACRLTGSKAMSADTETQNLSALLEYLPRLYESKDAAWMTCDMILELLYERLTGDRTYDPLRTAIEGLTSKRRTGEIRPNATGLGRAFHMVREKVVKGAWLVSKYDKTNERNLWCVESISKPLTARERGLT